ncbi:MAG: type II toxin-antitoxin system CcdA family antitoxin [Caulobacter sp.]|nr:type II toxin-antitoxin system CcdA family antitoxin [Caulobacter sp.]
MAKTSITLGIDSDLLARARALGLDLAEVLEIALGRPNPADGVEEAGAAFEHGERPEAIADYNRRIRERGCFGDTWRS